MRIIVKEKDGLTKEFQFSEGPISIGRAVNNKILLPDRAVSKEHAIISITDDGKWIVEDKDSANKTFLNGEAIHKAELKTGDCLRITCFTIEINLENKEPEIDEAAQLEDTLNLEASLAIPVHETVVRKLDASHAPAMRLPAKRLTDFLQAAEIICDANNLEEMLLTLLNIMLKQFSAFHTWCALREQPNGPMTYHAGKRRDGKAVELSDIKLGDKINQAVEKGQSLVMPRVAADVEEKERIRSAIIATIRRSSGCYGVMYIDNAMIHEHYSLSDLDYLMLLAMHTAAGLKKFINS
ncbi:MAG: FHA domain-containing protein [Sedimentisphaerales bacterium]|nr:FHA domain-containing protein [Sedimentisphaerales bacterium]